MISIILIDTQHPGNIGAIARSIKNFGFFNLILINPKCNHLCEESRQRAKHAQEVLENTKIVKSIKDLEIDLIVGTTAKTGTDYNLVRNPLSIKKLAKKIISHKNKVGILIGRENDGLHNDELKLCDILCTIPSNPLYPTLNIAHATTIILYELFLANNSKSQISHIVTANKTDLNQINFMFNELFDSLEFDTKEKKETQKVIWKKVIGKSTLSKRESFAIMGLLRKLNNLHK